MSYGTSIKDIELNRYKFVAQLDRLAALAREEEVFPATVELDLVDFCNHRCQWCVDPSHGAHTLSTAFVGSLLEELAHLGVDAVVFKGGGEPQLHEDFSEILAQTSDLGFETGVVTNGSRLREHYETVVEKASYLRTSIDGPTEASHRRIHGSDDFAIITEGVARTIERRDARRQRHPIVGLSFAMDYSIVDLVNEAVHLGDGLGVNYILVRPPFLDEVGRANTMNWNQKQQLFEAFEQARTAYKGSMEILIDYWISDTEAAHMMATDASPRRGSFAHLGANGIEHVTRRCRACPLLAVVAADQQVYPCCNLRFLEEWAIGKVDYGNGIDFTSVWRGDRRKAVMERIHRVECLSHCTHPMSRYNEIIEYLKSPRYHKGFV